MKKLQKKRKGFTLIELVVVIVIIAILAAVALLRFGAFTETAKDSRIRQEHAQLIAAGNMWRASQSLERYVFPPNTKSMMRSIVDFPMEFTPVPPPRIIFKPL